MADYNSEGEEFMTPIQEAEKQAIKLANLDKLKKFTNGFENKSKVDTNEICREVRGKN